MDTIKHHEMVVALVKSGQAIVDTMNAGEAHALHMAVGISGESGELLDAIKKHVIYKKPLDLNNVIEELGDIEFYLEGLRQGLGITRELTLTNNIAKLSERYKGLKYSNEAAQARADKVGAVIPEGEKWLHEAETKEALERSFAHVEGLTKAAV